MTNLVHKIDYPSLREEVTEVLREGKERAIIAVEVEKTNTYHTVGRLIHEHVLRNNARAEYGEQVITRLAADVGISRSLVYQILAFYRQFPKVQSPGKLGWTHYSLLLGLPDEEQRNFYAEETARKSLSTRALRTEIRNGTFGKPEGVNGSVEQADPEGPFEPKRGVLNTYRVLGAEKAASTTLWLDLGFGIQRGITCDDAEAYAPESIVAFGSTDGQNAGYEITEQDNRDRLYTYVARVERVIDGDTLWVVIDCGFQNRTRQKIRLRGIDTPELPTKDGVKAKAYVEDIVERSPFVVLTTSKSDKYDRYLADLFYMPRQAPPAAVAEKGFFLNRKLMLEGLADRYTD
jgi:endonuclease YncB( thermonuclease family)